jgi:glycosyltransferase involved in cell wall biosynthesis
MRLSVVIPVYNEEECIPPLLDALNTALAGVDFEVVFVDDGSKDSTVEQIRKRMPAHWQLVIFRRNYGQTSAMAAGIAAARGEYIATMDGDLQNDPADIPLMIEKLEREGLDAVVGWRQKRQDNQLRKIPSKIANKLIRRLTGVYVHDYGCTLKVFTQETAKDLDLYGEFSPDKTSGGNPHAGCLWWVIFRECMGAVSGAIPAGHTSRLFWPTEIQHIAQPSEGK